MIVPRFQPSTTLRGAVSSFLRSLVLPARLTGEYEQRIRRFFEKEYVVVFPQARIALYSIVKALLPERAEVILSAYNVPVVIEYLEAAGAKLRFVDIVSSGFHMDVAKASAAISKQTRAVIVSHMNGRGMDFADLVSICRERKILIIEDAAQAFGSSLESSDSRLHGRLCGTVGDVGVFSTGIHKKFSTIVGGFVVTDDRAVYERLQAFKEGHRNSLRRGIPIMSAVLDGLQFIMASNRAVFPLVFWLFKDKVRSINVRDDKRRGAIDPALLPFSIFEAWQACQGIRSFKSYSRTNEPFVLNSSFLEERLSRASGADPTFCNYLHYPVRVRDRDEVIREINRAGYDIGPGKFFNYGGGECPIAERAARENLNVPLHRGVGRDDLGRMASIIESHQKSGEWSGRDDATSAGAREGI